ncbi:hypothetical protein AEP_00536 [Curvibacter sp. AEP1-3]|uniref:hypothetical protein n=1 Tax=Curvibacter sp. AEP1-3 TaxID=1844971 RepID=UPI000B3CAFB0|nr:hypothetical protein [Curvibacter sp. AEP1-3]ARV17496.1 hypothetical protein AEP_00536 [Curvibacter sp. AEP1-3]
MQTQELLLAAQVRLIAKEMQQELLKAELSGMPEGPAKDAKAADLVLHNPVHSFTGAALEELKEYAALINTYLAK